MEHLLRTYQDEGPDRLDAFIAYAIDELSREYAKQLIKLGQVKVTGHVCDKPSRRLECGDVVDVTVPEPAPLDCPAEAIPLDIKYEDEHLLVLVKPRGMVCHPMGHHNTGTLVNALLHHCQFLSGIQGVERPGIVHRLDKDTTGLLVVAKSDLAHRGLTDQFKSRSTVKHYITLVKGYFPSHQGVIEIPIGRDSRPNRMRVDRRGKEAVTDFERLQIFHKSYSLMRVRIRTGRTHQIRVHFAHLGNPVIGDPWYGTVAHEDADFDGMALHAWRLQFRHPATEKWMAFAAPLPDDFKALIRHVRAGGRA